MRQCIIGNCHFSLVSCLSFKLQPFHSESDKLLDSSQWTFLRFFQRPQKNQRDWSSEDLTSSIKLGTPRHSPVDVGVAVGDDGGRVPPVQISGRDVRPNIAIFKENLMKKSIFLNFSIFTKSSHRNRR